MPRWTAFLAGTLALGVAGGWPSAEEPPLPLDPLGRRGEIEGVAVVSAAQTAPLPGRILDLAFLSEDRLAVVSEDAVSVYRRDAQSLRREAHRPHPPPFVPARAPAAWIQAVETERAFWVATNRQARVRLFTWEGSRLAESQQADALPGGLRYVSGTNQMDRDGTPVLRVRQGLVVSPEGLLGVMDDGPVTWTGLRVGDAVARPWPRIAAASSARPPGAADSLDFYELGAEPRLLGLLPLEGSVGALASRRHGDEAALALAIRTEAGDRLLFLRLAREER